VALKEVYVGVAILVEVDASELGVFDSNAPGLQLSQNIQNIMASTTAATMASQQPITVFRHGFQPQPGFPQFPQFQGQQFRMQPPNFSQRPVLHYLLFPKI
jgi:hypothetical protein